MKLTYLAAGQLAAVLMLAGCSLAPAPTDAAPTSSPAAIPGDRGSCPFIGERRIESPESFSLLDFANLVADCHVTIGKPDDVDGVEVDVANVAADQLRLTWLESGCAATTDILVGAVGDRVAVEVRSNLLPVECPGIGLGYSAMLTFTRPVDAAIVDATQEDAQRDR